MTLRWEASDSGEYAYSGNARIGMIVKKSVGDRKWVYQVDGVNAKWVAKTWGEVSSAQTAKAAVERAWAAWIEHASLRPA